MWLKEKLRPIDSLEAGVDEGEGMRLKVQEVRSVKSLFENSF